MERRHKASPPVVSCGVLRGFRPGLRLLGGELSIHKREEGLVVVGVGRGIDMPGAIGFFVFQSPAPWARCAGEGSPVDPFPLEF